MLPNLLYRCIPHAWMCDGDKDCPDGTDEKEEDCSKCIFVTLEMSQKTRSHIKSRWYLKRSEIAG